MSLPLLIPSLAQLEHWDEIAASDPAALKDARFHLLAVAKAAVAVDEARRALKAVNAWKMHEYGLALEAVAAAWKAHSEAMRAAGWSGNDASPDASEHFMQGGYRA